jgi:hypothetical protein
MKKIKQESKFFFFFFFLIILKNFLNYKYSKYEDVKKKK